jgi:hypothetical protein
METWYEVEVEVEPARWAVIRRDVPTKAEALRRVTEVQEDDAARHAQDVRRGRASKGSKATVRNVRAVKCTREII